MAKRVMAVCFILILLLTSSVHAEGVQVIGSGNTTENVSYEDIKMGVDITIDDYAIITPVSFEFTDQFGWYRQGRNDVYWSNDDYDHSGHEAEYAIIRFDIINLSKKEKNFLGNVSGKYVYDDSIEFGGRFDQLNYDNKTDGGGPDANNQNKRWCIHETDQFGILPLYQGHYWFVAAIPNAAVDSKKPLSVVISIDGNEFTYQIRK